MKEFMEKNDRISFTERDERDVTCFGVLLVLEVVSFNGTEAIGVGPRSQRSRTGRGTHERLLACLEGGAAILAKRKQKARPGWHGHIQSELNG